MEDIKGVIQLPGTQQLLSSLPPDRWTIVTSCTRPLAAVRLRAAGLSLPLKMVTSGESKNGKPHPEPYQKAAATLGYAAVSQVGCRSRPNQRRSAPCTDLGRNSPPPPWRAWAVTALPSYGIRPRITRALRCLK